MTLTYLELFLAELRRTWIQFIRYPSEALVGTFVTVITFYFLFAGASFLAGPNAVLQGAEGGGRLELLVVGYVLSILVVVIFSTTANNLEREASTGTLEQIFLTPVPSILVLGLRSIANLTVFCFTIGASLGLILLITGSQLSFPVVLLLPLLTLLVSAFGIAFAVAGLVLIFKRVAQVLGAVQFGLFFLLGAPVEMMTGWGRAIAYFAPMVPSASLLRDLMVRELPLDTGAFALALVSALAYLLLGLFCFARCERVAKQRGLLSGY